MGLFSGVGKFLFGSDKSSSDTRGGVDDATAEFLQQLRGNATETWAKIAPILESLQGEADKSYQAQQAGLNFELPQNALDFLGQMKNESISGLKTDIDTLLGRNIADLAKKGMLSSSTAEGSFGEIGRQIAPQIAGINQDYWANRLNMPFTVADRSSGAIQNKLSMQLEPLFRAWQTAAGGGATPTGQWGTSTGTSPSTGVLPSMLTAFAGGMGGGMGKR